MAEEEQTNIDHLLTITIKVFADHILQANVMGTQVEINSAIPWESENIDPEEMAARSCEVVANQLRSGEAVVMYMEEGGQNE